MNRLARFAECISKFCKETGKPGPCADPNSKRQQRMKGLGTAAKPKSKAPSVAKSTPPPASPEKIEQHTQHLHRLWQGIDPNSTQDVDLSGVIPQLRSLDVDSLARVGEGFLGRTILKSQKTKAKIIRQIENKIQATSRSRRANQV